MNADFSPDSILIMRPLIRILAISVIFNITAQNIIAGTASAKPLRSFSFKISQIKLLNVFLSGSAQAQTEKGRAMSSKVKETAGRVCSCQILDLESSNYKYHHVVLLAEKTNFGSISDYGIARNHIEKEKKHLKQMFYDKIKMVSEIHRAVSCSSLYFTLKSADSQLQLYEILNADAN